MNTKSLTQNQVTALKCAFADLLGSLQAFDQDDIYLHDWQSHLQTILELGEAFPGIAPRDVAKAKLIKPVRT